MCRHSGWMRAAFGLALLVIAIAGAAPARAGVDSWTPFGPGQGRITAVAASSRGDLYAVTAFGEVAEIWQMPAGAASWRWRSNGLGRPQVTAIAVHPTQPDSLWALTGGPAAALFHSSDAGATWLRVAAFPVDFAIRSLWVVPLRESVVLFAEAGPLTPPYLIRSADGGLTWSGVPDAWGPVAAAIDRPGLVYAADGSGPGINPGVVRSTDGGQTFERVRLGVHHNDSLYALHVTRGRRPLVFASFGGGLFRSTDGERFEPVGFPNGGPSALGSDPRDPQRIYAADGKGLYTSTRSGRKGSFRKTRDVFPVVSLPTPTAMVMGATGPVLLAGGDLRDARLQTLAETGMTSFGVAEVTISEQRPASLAARTYLQCTQQCDLRTFVSQDAGASFSLLAFQILPLQQVQVTDLAFDPALAARRLETSAIGTVLFQPERPIQVLPYQVDTVGIAARETLLAGGTQGVQRREGEAGIWQTALPTATAGGTLRVVDLRVDPFATDGVTALALETATGTTPPMTRLVAYRSRDGGAHWSPLLPGVAGLLDVEPGFTSTQMSLFALFAVAGGTELRRSDDGGATSVAVHTFTTAEEVTDFAVDQVAIDVLYAASATGLLRSRDAGATWESTPGTFDAWGSYRQRLQRLWVHPTERGHVFAGPLDGGLFENRLSD